MARFKLQYRYFIILYLSHTLITSKQLSNELLDKLLYQIK